jgi:hypothetical protein
MKTIFATTAVMLAAAVPAVAMTSTDVLSSTEKAEVRAMLPSADVENLDVAEVTAVRAILNTGDDRDQRQGLRSIFK